MRHRLAILAFLFAPLLAVFGDDALAQGAIQQSGPSVSRHVPCFIQSGLVQDCGNAAGQNANGSNSVGASEFVLIAPSNNGQYPAAATGSGPFGTNICDLDAPVSNPTGFHFICFGPNVGANALIAVGAVGSASALPLNFNINGVNYPFPGSGNGNVLGPPSSVNNDLACYNGTSGTFIDDCGIGIGKSSASIAAGGSGAIATNNAQITVTGLNAATGNGQSVTITWAALLPTSLVQATWAGGTSAGIPILKAVPGSGSLTLTLTNAGSSSFNGSVIVDLQILP